METRRSAFERLLEAVVLALITALALVVVVGVGFRKAGAALVWYDEVASVLLAWLTYYGAALAALRRSHIAVPTLLRKAPPRLRLPLFLVAEATVVAFFAVTAWGGFRVLQILSGEGLVSIPWMPLRVTQSVIPIGAVLFITAQLMSFRPALRTLMEHEEPGA